MKTDIVIDISPPNPYFEKCWFSSYEPKCCQPIILQDSLNCTVSRKKWMMKYIFGKQISFEVFYKLILSFWVFVTRHAESTPKKFAYLWGTSRKAWLIKLIFFAISLQYLKENVKNEVDFLPEEKHQSFL